MEPSKPKIVTIIPPGLAPPAPTPSPKKVIARPANATRVVTECSKSGRDEPQDGQLVCFATPARTAKELLGYCIDPYIARPQDLLRRALDALAMALRWWVLGTMLASKGGIHFKTKRELKPVPDVKPVYGLPVIAREKKERGEDKNVYKFVNSAHWRDLYTLDKEASGQDWAMLKTITECLHMQEVGYLLLHIKHAGEGWREFYHPGTAQVAEALFTLRCFLTHRGYLALGIESSNVLQALGKCVFRKIHRLLCTCINLSAIQTRSDLAQAVESHKNDVTGIAKVFDHLMRRYYTGGIDTPTSSGKKIKALLLFLERGDGPTITPAEHFTIAHLGSRFRWSKTEDTIYEAPGAKLDEELMIKLSKLQGEDHFFSRKTIRRWEINDRGRLDEIPYTLIDPFSVTHIDMFNRAYDFMSLAIREILRIGLQDMKGANRDREDSMARMLVSELLESKPWQGLHPVTCDPKHPMSKVLKRVQLEAPSERLGVWMSSTTDDCSRALLEIYADYWGLDDYFQIADQCIERCPLILDPRSILEFLNRIAQPTKKQGTKTEEKSELFLALKEKVDQFQNIGLLRKRLANLIRFRDCIGHQSNLSNAAMVKSEKMDKFLRHLKEMLQLLAHLLVANPVPKRFNRLHKSLALVDELQELTSASGKYRTFRRRQWCLQGIGNDAISDTARCNRLRAHSIVILERLASHLRDTPGDEISEIVRVHTSQLIWSTRKSSPAGSAGPTPEMEEEDDSTPFVIEDLLRDNPYCPLHYADDEPDMLFDANENGKEDETSSARHVDTGTNSEGEPNTASGVLAVLAEQGKKVEG